MQVSSTADRLSGFRRTISDLAPGLLAVATVAAAARFLSDHYGGPAMLFALLLGLAFHFLSVETRCAPGIEFATKRILRFGVALLGIRMTFGDVTALGLTSVLIVVAAVTVTLLSGLAFARLCGRGWRFGLLTGGSVAICGASAAMAIAAVLPRNEHTERNMLFTVISVTTLSTVAMIAYPIFTQALGWTDQQAGLFIGATIHDVAQVVGAGYSISEPAGDTATLAKLLRVAMLVPIVLIFALLFRNHPGTDAGNGSRLPIPGFLFGFAALVAIGSIWPLPTLVVDVGSEASRWCLLMAIAAVGMKTSLKSMGDVSLQHGLVVVGETVFLAAVVVLAISVIA